MSSWFLCHLINWAPSCYTVLWQYHFLHFILLLDCLQAKCASLLFLQMESHCVMFSSYLKWHLMEAVISCSQHFSRLPPCIRVSFPKPRRNSFQVYIFFLSFLYVGGKMVPCFIIINVRGNKGIKFLWLQNGGKSLEVRSSVTLLGSSHKSSGEKISYVELGPGKYQNNHCWHLCGWMKQKVRCAQDWEMSIMVLWWSGPLQTLSVERPWDQLRALCFETMSS